MSLTRPHSFAFPTTGRLPAGGGRDRAGHPDAGSFGHPARAGRARHAGVAARISSDPDAETIRADFTLCGFWEGNQSSYSSMAWVSRVYRRQDDRRRPLHRTRKSDLRPLHGAGKPLQRPEHRGGDGRASLRTPGSASLEYSVNLAYSPEMGAVAAQESPPMYLGMGLVFIAGYLIIYNIFQISVTADVQFYGKLKTLGTTTRQLKKLIYGSGQPPVHRRHPAGAASWAGGLGTLLVPVLLGMMEGDERSFCKPRDLYRFRPVCLGHRASSPACVRRGWPGKSPPSRRCGPAMRRTAAARRRQSAIGGTRIPRLDGLGQPVDGTKSGPPPSSAH